MSSSARKVAFALPASKRSRLSRPTTASEPDDDDDDEHCESTTSALRFQEEGAAKAMADDWEGALQCFSAAVQHDPTCAAAHEQRAQILLEMGRDWQAVQASHTACSLAPQWGDAWLTLARCQFNYGEPALALASAETAIALGCTESDCALRRELQCFEDTVVRCGLAAARLAEQQREQQQQQQQQIHDGDSDAAVSLEAQYEEAVTHTSAQGSSSSGNDRVRSRA